MLSAIFKKEKLMVAEWVSHPLIPTPLPIPSCFRSSFHSPVSHLDLASPPTPSPAPFAPWFSRFQAMVPSMVSAEGGP